MHKFILAEHKTRFNFFRKTYIPTEMFLKVWVTCSLSYTCIHSLNRH